MLDAYVYKRSMGLQRCVYHPKVWVTRPGGMQGWLPRLSLKPLEMPYYGEQRRLRFQTADSTVFDEDDSAEFQISAAGNVPCEGTGVFGDGPGDRMNSARRAACRGGVLFEEEEDFMDADACTRGTAESLQSTRIEQGITTP